MPETVKVYAKAIAATLTALGAWGYQVTQESSAAGSAITANEAWGLCGVAVIGLSVLITPNAYPIRRR